MMTVTTGGTIAQIVPRYEPAYRFLKSLRESRQISRRFW